MRRSAAVLCSALALAAPVRGQDAASVEAPAPAAVTWRLSAGKASLWIRDVARSRLWEGVDASPVSWEATGGALTAERDHGDDRRVRRLQASFEYAGRALYRTPLAVLARPGGDGAHRVAGKVEHGAFLFVDLAGVGLDMGFSLQGGAELTSVTRHFDPSIEARVRETNLTTSLAAMARLRRWGRFQLEAAWVNGGVLVRTTTDHSTAVEEAVGGWGVGWLTDLEVRVDGRVTNRVALSASYLGSGGGRFVSHGASAWGRRRWMMGVSYGR